MAGPSPAKLLRNERAFQLFRAAYLKAQNDVKFLESKEQFIQDLADNALRAADIFHNRSSRRFEEE